jgi:hypothetical protein
MDVLSAHVRDADLFRDHAGAELLREPAFDETQRHGAGI